MSSVGIAPLFVRVEDGKETMLNLSFLVCVEKG